MEKIKTDVVVVGTGAAGLYHALHLPKELQICMITKDEVDRSDSFLAQGGMCMLRDEEDYDGYFEDTMRAGHYENDPKSVEIMIRSSRQIAKELLGYGAVSYTHLDVYKRQVYCIERIICQRYFGDFLGSKKMSKIRVHLFE